MHIQYSEVYQGLIFFFEEIEVGEKIKNKKNKTKKLISCSANQNKLSVYFTVGSVEYQRKEKKLIKYQILHSHIQKRF